MEKQQRRDPRTGALLLQPGSRLAGEEERCDGGGDDADHLVLVERLLSEHDPADGQNDDEERDRDGWQVRVGEPRVRDQLVVGDQADAVGQDAADERAGELLARGRSGQAAPVPRGQGQRRRRHDDDGAPRVAELRPAEQEDPHAEAETDGNNEQVGNERAHESPPGFEFELQDTCTRLLSLCQSKNRRAYRRAVPFFSISSSFTEISWEMPSLCIVTP